MLSKILDNLVEYNIDSEIIIGDVDVKVKLYSLTTGKPIATAIGENDVEIITQLISTLDRTIH